MLLKLLLRNDPSGVCQVISGECFRITPEFRILSSMESQTMESQPQNPEFEI